MYSVIRFRKIASPDLHVELSLAANVVISQGQQVLVPKPADASISDLELNERRRVHNTHHYNTPTTP